MVNHLEPSFVSNDAKTLVYESWDKERGLPSGVPTTFAVDQIDELREC
jgi:hypothetical protein